MTRTNYLVGAIGVYSHLDGLNTGLATINLQNLQQPSSNATPTFEPIVSPDNHNPTLEPTHEPTKNPVASPTVVPTLAPSVVPSFEPTMGPNPNPTMEPTNLPVSTPTDAPISNPTAAPFHDPTPVPTFKPSHVPTIEPTNDSQSNLTPDQDESSSNTGASDESAAADADASSASGESANADADASSADNGGQLNYCGFTFYKGTHDMSAPKGCALFANDDLTFLTQGANTPAFYGCADDSSTIYITPDELTKVGLMVDGKSQVTSIYPGPAVFVTFYTEPDFTGYEYSFNANYHHELTHFHFEGTSLGNDAIKSIKIKSLTSSFQLPDECENSFHL